MSERTPQDAADVLAVALYGRPAKIRELLGGSDCRIMADAAEMIVRLKESAASRRDKAVEINYTNHRGERSMRRVIPVGVHFSSSKWHPKTQWLLDAFDTHRGFPRSFAMADIHAWSVSGLTDEVTT